MKKILTFLLFLSLHGYASSIDDTKPTNSKASVNSALPLISPQLSSVSQTSSSSFNVIFWDKNLDETDNEFEYKIDAATTWSSIPLGAFSGANFQTVPLTFSGGLGSFTITARMRAKHATSASLVSYSAYTSEFTFVFSNIPPPTPIIAGFASYTETSAFISWRPAGTNEQQYVVERTDFNGPYGVVGNFSSNVLNFTDTGLKHNTTYGYRIKACNTNGCSEYVYGNVTTRNGTPPAPGRASLGVISHSKILVNWVDLSVNENNFIIQRAGTDGVYKTIATPMANITNYTDSSVEPGTQYFYRIASTNSFATSTYTYLGDITTPKKQPNDPSNIVATPVSFNKVDISWKDNSGDEDGFELERAEGNGFVLLTKLPSNTNTYSDSTTKENTTYGYRIRTYNTSGKSEYATSEDIKTQIAPATDLIAIANTYNEVKLTWKDNSKNETGYVVEKSTDGTTFTAINLPSNTTSYTDNAVVDNASYTYRVYVKNGTDNSTKTANVTVKTPLKPLNPPTVLTLKSLSDNEISLTWQDNEGLETGFEIQRSKDGTNFTKIAEVKTNIVTYLDANLDASTKYYYRVRAFNEKQFSIFSNIAEISTLVTTSVTKEKLTETIKVYPNPAQDKINVDYPAGTENINLISQFGALISTKNVDKTSTSTEINLSGIPSGMYFISAVNKSNIITKKIIKN